MNRIVPLFLVVVFIALFAPTALTADVYDPWQDKWSAAELSETKVALPDFRRSLVVRVAKLTGR